MLITELLLDYPDDSRPALIADSLARGDRWTIAPGASARAIIAVTLAPDTVASLVEVAMPAASTKVRS